MSLLESEFPGKPGTRYSYEISKELQKTSPPNEESLSTETEGDPYAAYKIVNGLNSFRQHFGSSDDVSCFKLYISLHA